MNKILVLFFGLAAFVAGSIIGWKGATNHYSHMIDRTYNHVQIGAMVMSTHALELIRSGNTTNGIEYLENNIDWTLFGLTPFLEQKPESLTEQVDVQEIQKVRDYRAKFPRKTGKPIDADVARAFELLNAPSKP